MIRKKEKTVGVLLRARPRRAAAFSLAYLAKGVKKQDQPDFRPAAPAIKGRIESRKQEHVGGSYAFHGFYDTDLL